MTEHEMETLSQAMTGFAEAGRVARRIERASDAGRLRSLFDELVAGMGHEAASRLWWAWFGARDAAET